MSLEADVESIAYAIWESLLGLPIDVNRGDGLGADSPTTSTTRFLSRPSYLARRNPGRATGI